MMLDNLAFVDIETTGLSARRDRIIEIGILRMEKGEIVDTFQTLINPQTYINPYISEITGITPRQLEDAPTFTSVRKKIFTLLQDAVFVAHNARFDYTFIRRALLEEEVSFRAKQLCTVKLARLLYPKLGRYNLDSLISAFSLICKRRHRALDDASVLVEFFSKIQKDFDKETLGKALDIVLKKPSIPASITKETIESLPESPGIYTFYAGDKTPLYIGKSKNIKERVLQHFQNDHVSSTDLRISQQTTDIGFMSTAGELTALLKESAAVKFLQPLYNKQLRLSQNLIVLKTKKDLLGYDNVVVEKVSEIALSDLSNIYGIFRSKKSAELLLSGLVKTHNLCEKLTGIEKTKSGCFAYRLGICKGACVGKEKAPLYNARQLIAFSKYKIKKWPFSSAIAIREENLERNIESYVIIDQWCLVGTYTKEGQEFKKETFVPSFDTDTYAILRRHILKLQPRDIIQIHASSPLAMEKSLRQVDNALFHSLI